MGHGATVKYLAHLDVKTLKRTLATSNCAHVGAVSGLFCVVICENPIDTSFNIRLHVTLAVTIIIRGQPRGNFPRRDAKERIGNTLIQNTAPHTVYININIGMGIHTKGNSLVAARICSLMCLILHLIRPTCSRVAVVYYSPQGEQVLSLFKSHVNHRAAHKNTPRA